MDTLVSVGVLAAYGWSTYALFFTAAGDAGMKMSMSLVPSRGDPHHLYFEVASATVALILLGRYFEARAKRRAGGALRALLRLGATTATVVLPDGRARRTADRRTSRRRPVRRVAGRADRHRRGRRGRCLGSRHFVVDRRERARRRRRRKRSDRGDDQHLRSADRARHPGRLGDLAGADGPAGRGGTDRQGSGAAPRRSCRCGVRADRHRAWPRRRWGSGWRAPVMDRRRRPRGVGVDHRLPVCARTGHADRAAGGHRPRRAAGTADQGPRGPREHAHRRHGRARQDRHRHHRSS